MGTIVGYSHWFDSCRPGWWPWNTKWMSFLDACAISVHEQELNMLTIDFCWTQGFWNAVSADDHWRWLMTSICLAWHRKSWGQLVPCVNGAWMGCAYNILWPTTVGFCDMWVLGKTLLNKGVELLGYIYIICAFLPLPLKGGRRHQGVSPFYWQYLNVSAVKARWYPIICDGIVGRKSKNCCQLSTC